MADGRAKRGRPATVLIFYLNGKVVVIMPLIEHVKDWRKVFANYDIVRDRLPVKDELVYVSYVGIFTADNVYKNGDIDVNYNGKIKRLPTSHYRLIIRKGVR